MSFISNIFGKDSVLTGGTKPIDLNKVITLPSLNVGTDPNVSKQTDSLIWIIGGGVLLLALYFFRNVFK